MSARVSSASGAESLGADAMSASSTIVVSAIVFERSDGRVLTVRKRGTTSYMLPGGKPEPGESAAQTAAREADEELDVQIAAAQLELVGEFRTQAANEAGSALIATVFRCRDEVHPRVRAEIDDARWVHPAAAINDPDQAPLNREHIFPLLSPMSHRGETGAF